MDELQDEIAISQLIEAFFKAFDNRNNVEPPIDTIRQLTIAEVLIIKNVGDDCDIYNLDSFLKPRKVLLNSGKLTQFCEVEISHKTEVFGNIAHRFSTYKKSGCLDNKWFECYGKKSIQLVKMDKNWKISAVIWDDERDGLVV
ncbi:hypothetical protein [Aliikangiella sp. IMCC44359]|uniref:hypothetical protein n=1 Tax=Aliikangiella sp. IMCC44359 TaxID=3459125 RepID=UPI00403AEEAC